MSSLRRQKQFKITVSELEQIVQSRNHTLLQEPTKSLKNACFVPKQSKIALRCSKCNHQWETKVYAYLNSNAPSLGCRKCYETMLQNDNIYSHSPFRSKKQTTDKLHRRSGKNALRKACKQGPYGHIQNIKQLIDYLKDNPNAYNDKVLELILRNEATLTSQTTFVTVAYATRFKKTKNKTYETSMHHVIPLHAKGSPDSWNIILVTKQEHHDLHQLRYTVYSEKPDLLATYGTQSDVIKAETGFFQKTKKPKPNSSGIQKLPPEVSAAFKQGIVLAHKDGYNLTIIPNSVQTMKELLELLINVLPDNHSDKNRIFKNKTSINYIRSLIITAFPSLTTVPLQKQVHSAYGFTVQKYN